jgi:putative restriction endonuclease
MPRQNWTREELIVAFNLYCKTPFAKINSTNLTVIDLANTIGRSPSALALKLVNFARLDPTLQERGISGMSHGSKGEIEIWYDFNEDWEKLSFESEIILSKFRGKSLESSVDISIDSFPSEGADREAFVKTRVNQSFFRNTVLASYNYHCCITGISIPELLIAGHIIPWSVDKKNRMNPLNGVCMNALHDRAFDKGLMTITPDYYIRFSEKLENYINKSSSELYFQPFMNKRIILPQKFLPDKRFLEYHNEEIFIH